MNTEENRKLQAAVLQSLVDRRTKVVSTLPQGFTFRPDGRSGFIYYRAGDRVLEIYVETSAVARYDMLVWPEGLDEWVYPESAPLSSDERIDVRRQFRTWLKHQKFKTDYQ
jgi:hypothetical protein